MKTNGSWPLALLLAGLLCTACGDDSPGGSNGNINQNTNQIGPIGAPGVTITEVAIYQGPKCTVMSGGVAQSCDVPLVNGRDALIRVFYATDPSMVGQQVTAWLTIDAEHSYQSTETLGMGSDEANYLSTLNFVVPGEAIDQFFSYQVAILVDGTPDQDNPTARFPASGMASVPVEGPVNTFRVYLSPFEYCADGSCRVPNLDAVQVEAFRQRFLQLYPVTAVEVTVRDPYTWSSVIGPDGTGWQQVGMTLSGFRSQDGAGADVYYYGIFNPAANLASFCGGGCLLGVTLLNSSPPAEGNPQLRLALGVGFDDVAVDTAAHELGHAHGLQHVNCGYGIDPQSVDPAYPYSPSSIGVWSWDIINEVLIGPDSKSDIMGYCEDQWISDYHYTKLYDRAIWVNLPRVTGSTRSWDYLVLAVDGKGGGTINPGVFQSSHELRGQQVQVLLQGPDGPSTATGQYFHWDHMDGGWVFVPVGSGPVERAELAISGVPSVVELARRQP